MRRETFQVICIRYGSIFNLFNSPYSNKKQLLIHSTTWLRKKRFFYTHYVHTVTACRQNEIWTEVPQKCFPNWHLCEHVWRLLHWRFKHTNRENLTALRQLGFERPSFLSCHFVHMIHIWSPIPERRLWNSFWTGWNLNPFLPFLFPRVRKDVILIRVDMVRIWEFHGTNEILAEHLQETECKDGFEKEHCIKECGRYFSYLHWNNTCTLIIFLGYQHKSIWNYLDY